MPCPARWRASVDAARGSPSHSCCRGRPRRQHARRHHPRRRGSPADRAPRCPCPRGSPPPSGRARRRRGRPARGAAPPSSAALRLLEGPLLPELPHEQGGLRRARRRARTMHRLDVADRGRARRRRRAPSRPGASSKAKATTRHPWRRASAAARPGRTPAPAIRARRTLHGRSLGQAISPRPSRIIRSISSATASDRRSSASGSSTWPVACAARAAPIRWRISSLSGLSLWTRRCSTNEAWR